jgi:hypothetical protein
MGGNIYLRCKGKTLLGDVNKLSVFKSFKVKVMGSNPDYLLESFLDSTKLKGLINL